jgi:hypothetical protein
MFRSLVTEALDKNNTIARSIVNRMDHANWKNISEMDEANYNFIKNICSGISQRFDEASDEDKQTIMDKVYSSIHTMKEQPEDESPKLDRSEIAKRILKFIEENGAVLFPKEEKADQLAGAILQIAESDKNEAEENSDVVSESTLTEATMSDIPHEIDDQIHTLKDMRFDVEETQKNWDLAGMDTKPMDDITSEINKLISVMYQKGAELADQEIAKSISDTEEEEIEKSSIDNKENL